LRGPETYALYPGLGRDGDGDGDGGNNNDDDDDDSLLYESTIRLRTSADNFFGDTVVSQTDTPA
jgi:hypothetical protein